MCLEFWYFMYVVPAAELNIYIRHIKDASKRKLWEIKGDQGREWKHASVPLLTHAESYQVSVLWAGV